MKRIVVICALMMFQWSYGQIETSADFRRQVYSKEMSGGFMLHTRGYGINIRRMKFSGGYVKLGMELDYASLRHPKEVKFQGASSLSSSNSYVYGKVNSFSTLRFGLGRERILIDKTDKGTISISWLFFGGGSFGWLKPVYLDIIKFDEFGHSYTVVERYDPEVHNYENISGQAAYFTGIGKSSLRMGLYAKTGFAFDINMTDRKVTTIEVGAIFDYFPSWGIYKEKDVPIMWNTENYSEWLQFYITLNFGAKWD